MKHDVNNTPSHFKMYWEHWKNHYIAAAIPLQTTMYYGDQFNKTMQYAIHALSGLFRG